MISSRQRSTSLLCILLALQVAFAAYHAPLKSNDSPTAGGRKHRHSPITLHQMYKELRREPDDFLSYHLLGMVVIAGYGDRLYNMTEDAHPSAECVTTAEATLAMTRQLSIGAEMDQVMTEVADAVMADVRSTETLKHPLEFFCQRLEKAYAEKSHLSAVFDRLKKSILASKSEGRPAAYVPKLFHSAERMAIFMLRRMSVPGMADSLANEEFSNQQNETEAYSSLHHVFAVSVAAMARKEEFAEKLQTLYEKALSDVVKEITAKKFRLDELLLDDEKTFWFLPRLVKIFYDYIAADETLKKELESTAATFGKDLDKSDLDFSKF